MRERHPVDLRQLRRCELFARQLVEEFRALQRSAVDEARIDAAELTDHARDLLASFEQRAETWRPIPLLGKEHVRRQIASLASARKAGRG
jgi:ribosomal protein S7